MPDRIRQVNQLVKRELGSIMLKEIDFPDWILVTLTRVEATPNLQEANVYVSVMPDDKIKDVMEVLNRRIYRLQQTLNNRLKMRPIPKIKFIEERLTREAGRVEELIEEIHKKENK